MTDIESIYENETDEVVFVGKINSNLASIVAAETIGKGEELLMEYVYPPPTPPTSSSSSSSDSEEEVQAPSHVQITPNTQPDALKNLSPDSFLNSPVKKRLLAPPPKRTRFQIKSKVQKSLN